MKRVMIFVYGVICYAITMATFGYMFGFIGNILVPKSIDSGAQGSVVTALLVNVVLVGLFGLQHSIMARPGFKKAWTKVVPKAAERSTYCLLSSVFMALLIWQWRPLGGVIWQVESAAAVNGITVLYVSGWALLVFTTFLLNHFDLFGLRQVYLNLVGKKYTHLNFATPMFYKYVRHPLYIGWFTIFWATPVMTIAHLVLAVTTTVYILIAIRYEERDLLQHHGERYRIYREHVPMLVPRGNKERAFQEALS